MMKVIRIAIFLLISVNVVHSVRSFILLICVNFVKMNTEDHSNFRKIIINKQCIIEPPDMADISLEKENEDNLEESTIRKILQVSSKTIKFTVIIFFMLLFVFLIKENVFVQKYFYGTNYNSIPHQTVISKEAIRMCLLSRAHIDCCSFFSDQEKCNIDVIIKLFSSINTESKSRIKRQDFNYQSDFDNINANYHEDYNFAETYPQPPYYPDPQNYQSSYENEGFNSPVEAYYQEQNQQFHYDRPAIEEVPSGNYYLEQRQRPTTPKVYKNFVSPKSKSYNTDASTLKFLESNKERESQNEDPQFHYDKSVIKEVPSSNYHLEQMHLSTNPKVYKDPVSPKSRNNKKEKSQEYRDFQQISNHTRNTNVSKIDKNIMKTVNVNSSKSETSKNLRISQNQDFEIKTKTDSFQTISEDLQSSQNHVINPFIMCPIVTRASGTSVVNALQQSQQQPPLYFMNPPIYSLSPSHSPQFQFSPFTAYNFYPYYNNYPASYPQMINGLNNQNALSKTSIQAAGQDGQYYICNPIPPPGNGIVNVPGVEIRRNSGQLNMQELLQATPKFLSNRTREAVECPNDQWSCFDGSKCIPQRLVCNNEANCRDASDETMCSCRDRVGDIRICDGYFDCPNGEDELNCFGCKDDEISCDDWSKFRKSTCIPIDQRCDGIKQCEITGKDEEDCSILADQIGHQSLYRISNTVGFLHRNFKGTWYPTCSGSEIWATDVCKIEAGPSEMLPKVRMVFTNAGYNGPFVELSPNNQITLVDSCLKNQATFVECPPMYCGLRITLKNPYRTEEVDTSVEELLNRFQRLRITEEPSNNINESSAESLEDNIVSDSRVVGGKACQPASWPWVVSIYKNGLFHCGGVLINDQWILTAAHCVDKYWFYYYEIQAGMLRRFSYSPMEQIRWAAVAIPHENYDKKTLKNDIALMKLSSPVRFNRYIRPICLPSEATAGRDFILGPASGTVCVAVGWGATIERGSDPDQLRQVEVPILSTCKHLDDIQGDAICAGLLEGGKDACQGDSGGPLMCRTVNNPSQWYLAGIVSHGEGCARPNEPGVYTKVSRYLEWINVNTNSKFHARNPLQTCPGFTCKATGKCLSKKKRCDKFVDCLLGDDETDCWATRAHSPIFFLRMRQNSNVLDETNRTQEKYFRCKKMLQLIDDNKVCDKVPDCEDGTDEINCSCVDYLRISNKDAICDGVTDCKDLSDEMDCATCNSGYFCRLSQTCIPLSQRCNDKIDCVNGEDEWDCVALTDGKTLTLDSDLRPLQTMKGIITINRFGVWRPLCTNASDNAPSIAANVCNLLSFEEYTVYHKLHVEDKQLHVTIDVGFPQPSPENSNRVQLEQLDDSETCKGLLIKCSNQSIVHRMVHDNHTTIGELYNAPWSALIHVDGKFRCTGTIISERRILTSIACLQGVFMEFNYITALLGKGKTYLGVESPHERTLSVANWITLNGSDITVLTTNEQINFTRYIQPAVLKTSVKFLNETCVAVGVENKRIRFIYLETIKCTRNARCFRLSPQNHANLQGLSSWIGTITCLSHHNWYFAGSFNNLNRTILKLPRISIIKEDITDIPSTRMDLPTCPHFRCKLGACIDKHKICNGINDCNSGEDEDADLCESCRLTGGYGCKPFEMKCKNGKCVQKSVFCDRINDCGDLSDEPAICSCRSYMELVYPNKVCDGVINCEDRSDEDPQFCGCKEHQHKCGESSMCFSKEMHCDGYKDCPNGEDESLCYSLKTNRTGYNSGQVMKCTAGIWHSGCFRRNYTTTDLEEICQQLGFTGGSARQLPIPENQDRVTVQPVMDTFQVTWLRQTKGNHLNFSIRTGNNPYVRLVEDPSCHRLYIECL